MSRDGSHQACSFPNGAGGEMLDVLSAVAPEVADLFSIDIHHVASAPRGRPFRYKIRIVGLAGSHSFNFSFWGGQAPISTNQISTISFRPRDRLPRTFPMAALVGRRSGCEVDFVAHHAGAPRSCQKFRKRAFGN